MVLGSFVVPNRGNCAYKDFMIPCLRERKQDIYYLKIPYVVKSGTWLFNEVVKNLIMKAHIIIKVKNLDFILAMGNIQTEIYHEIALMYTWHIFFLIRLREASHGDGYSADCSISWAYKLTLDIIKLETANAHWLKYMERIFLSICKLLKKIS